MNSYDLINKTDFKIDKTVYKLINKTLKKEKVKRSYFSIIIVDNKEMRSLNKKYRNKDEPTDVLSFRIFDKEDLKQHKHKMLGDIYISVDKVRTQALANNHSELREMGFLIIHGLLHLLGYEHNNKEEEDLMLNKQEEILNEIRRTKI